MKWTVLLLESEVGLSRSISAHLEQHDMRVYHASDLDTARAMLETVEPDILITELDNKDPQNGTLIRQCREAPTDRDPLILVTTFDRLDDEILERFRPDVILQKPFDVRWLTHKVKSISREGLA